MGMDTVAEGTRDSIVAVAVVVVEIVVGIVVVAVVGCSMEEGIEQVQVHILPEVVGVV